MESPPRRRRALTVTAEIAETLSRRYRCRMIGVWPRGTPDGRSGAPRFFYRAPAIPCPARDGRLIALDSAALGFLARPAERGEQPAHMSPVQSHAEGAVDDGGNASGGPEVGVELPGRGTPQEEAGELSLLRGRQLRWTTGRRSRRQGLEA